MKQFFALRIVFFLAITFSFLTGCNEKIARHAEAEKDMYDQPDKAAEFQINRTKNPYTGLVPSDKMWEAVLLTQQMKDDINNSPNIISLLNWTERGSYTDAVGPSNGNTRANNGVTSGRIDAICVDKADATGKTVWVGGDMGGLWKTTDITASPATWNLVNDFLGNMIISAITQDPTNTNIMYFSTGEAYYGGELGVGVFKSTDHGVTWAQLPSTSTYTRTSKILCDYQGNVYLGSNGINSGAGLMRSTNGGTTWTDITPAGLSNRICDLEITSTTGPGRLHVVAGISSTMGYRYTDIPSTVASGTWTTPVTTFVSGTQRGEIAVNGNTLYALPCVGNQVPTIYKSTDGGANWAPTAGQPTSGWGNGQGWYCLAAAINPADPNQCIVGGLDNFRTLDGGNSWVKISAWVGTTGQYVHADQHTSIWYDNGNKMLFGCDGGIFYSANGGTTSSDRNVNLRLKEFYSCAIHPSSTNYFLAGAQDNGTHQLNGPGLTSSVEVTGGDGAYVDIDQDQPQYQYGAYVYNQYRRSTNGGATWGSVNFSGSAGQFINPFDYDDLNNHMYCGYSGGQYLRWNDPQTGASSSIISIPSFNGQAVSAVTVSPYTANRVYFGTTAGRIVQVDNADLAVPTDISITGGSMAGYANGIIVGADDQHLMACFSSYGVTNVWVSTNGGTSWTANDGNLPDIPVYWGFFHPEDNTKAYIATETGVWETDLLNGAGTVWTPSPNFPTMRTTMFRYRSSDRTLLASTYGRGLWTATVPSATCTAASVTTNPSNSTICVGGNTSFTVVAGGTGPFGYQWQLSTTGAGGPWGNITNGGVYSNATTATLNITGATAGMNTYQYRCVVTGNCAPLNVNSAPALLTVNTATNISSQPVNSTLCAGGNTSFSVTATGTSLTYQWQESTNGGGTWNTIINGGVYGGATTTTLNLTGVTAGMNTYQYRCVVGSTCGSLNSNAAVLTVNAAPAITVQPAVSVSTCAGNPAIFSITATGGGLTYQWQESTDGGTVYNNLINGAPYSGVNSATLTINPTVVGMNNYKYKCVITGLCPPSPVTSNVSTLTVGTAMSISLQPVNSTLCAGGNTSFTINTTGTVTGYQWQESINGGGSWNNINNGGVYSGATTITLTLTGITGGMNNYQYRCVVSGNCPAINSNAATLTVNTAPNITSQPANSTICSTQNSSFSVVATGTAITYQWQLSTTGCGGAFANVVNGGVYSGATSATLTITGAPTTMNGYGYRCVINGTCVPAATSNCGLLTVNTPVNITTQPVNSTACAGTNTSFGIAVTGTSPTFQWQESTNGGGTWNNITNGGIYGGATTNTLALTGVTAGMNSYQYRCVVSGATSCAALNSGAAILTINTAPAITTQPVAGTAICSGQNTSYNVIANGTALTYQWQESTNGGASYTNLANGGVYSGVTTSTLNITAGTVGMNTYQYRCVISGTCSPAVTSAAAILTVHTPITTTGPANAVICATGTTSFTITAAGTSPTYQWQISTNGGTIWSTITNGGIYSGATSTTLTLTGVSAGMDTYKYRCLVTGTVQCGAVNSAVASLTVSPQPTVTLTASPYTKLLPGKTTTITASVNPPAGFTALWTLNGNSITPIGNTYTADVNKLGTYVVVATIGSCTSLPASIIISDSASSKLWIYPSPNDGRFTVSYYVPGASSTNKTTQRLTIYGSDGKQVYYNQFTVSQPYQLHQIDIRRYGSDVYYIVLREANGNKVKTGEAVVR